MPWSGVLQLQNNESTADFFELKIAFSIKIYGF